MIEWIITSSVLILIIVALRYFLKGKISLRLQYGLWALVLIRLLIPFSVGNSSISILNFTDRIAEDRVEAPYEEALPGESAGDKQSGEVPDTSQVVTPIVPGRDDVISSDDKTQGIIMPGVSVGSTTDKITPVVPGENTDEVDITTKPVPSDTTVPGTTIQDTVGVDREPGISQVAGGTDIAELPIGDIIGKVVFYIWLVGIVLVGGYLVFVNLHFTYGLKKSAKRLPEIKGYPLSVYLAKNIDTPCMHGLIRPAIYVTGEAMADEKVLHHVLEHETTHYRHGDHVWSVLRSVCLALHWYNPFVWLAAFLSRNDAELACDEGTINRIGEAEREEYGRTLIGLTCQKKNGLFVTATTMTGSKKSIKERIVLIAKKPKMAIYTLVAVLLIATVAIGCTFTGARGKEDTTTESSDNNEDETTNGDETTTGEEEPTTDTGNEDETIDDIPVVKGTVSAQGKFMTGVDTAGKALFARADNDKIVDEEAIAQWENLTSIDMYNIPVKGYDVIGLKSDGTVYSLKNNFENWTDVVQISASDRDVIGLKKDGTVLSKGTAYIDKEKWHDIVQVSAGYEFLVGLKKDKTVIAGGVNTYGQCEVSNWTDIEMVAAGYGHTVGLRSDGTVLVAGLNLFGENDVTSWRDIVFVAAGEFTTVGIKSDGRVVATGRNIDRYMDDLKTWTNMSYISIGYGAIVGVTRNGELVVSSIKEIPTDNFTNLLMPESKVVIDNTKELPAVTQKYVDVEITGKALSMPENSIIETVAGIGLMIPKDISDKVFYEHHDDLDNCVYIYLKSDMGVFPENGIIKCEYARLGDFEKVSIKDALQSLAVQIQPTWLVGDETVQKYVNDCFSEAVEQLCALRGVENIYKDYKLIDADGSSALTDASFFYNFYLENMDSLNIDDGYVYIYSTATDYTLNSIENVEEYGEVNRCIIENITKIKPFIVTENKANKATELETIVMAMFDNKEFPISVEKSLGKGLQNEVFYANEYPVSNYHLDLDYKVLFHKNLWHEVTEAEYIKQIDKALDFGFIRVFNDNKEEFIVLKSVNGAIYKTVDGVRYFAYVRSGEDTEDYSYLNYSYDGFAFDMRLERLVIDDDPKKTRDELAYDMMEAYRVCGTSLLPDNRWYFDNLKIIELKSYDESDSDPESLIGVITEDVLRFWVRYAINTNGIGAVGSWDYGEGEYEGYMTNSFDVGAERIDGKWYCYRMGNG